LLKYIFNLTIFELLKINFDKTKLPTNLNFLLIISISISSIKRTTNGKASGIQYSNIFLLKQRPVLEGKCFRLCIKAIPHCRWLSL